MTSKHREFHGLLPNGEWIFLGASAGTDEEITEFMSMIAVSFRENKNSYFNVKSAVFRTLSFCGVRVTPEVEAGE